MYLLVGNWCPGPGEKGFSVYEYDSRTGELTFLNHSENDIAASFLTKGIHDNFIFAANETDAVIEGAPVNQIVSLDVSAPSAGVKVVLRKPSLGPNPTWICSTYDNKHLLITHHGGFCNTSTIKMEKDGTITENIVYDEPHVILYRLGEDDLPDRPVDAFLPERADYYPGQMSRSHSVVKTPGKNLYIICDKGLDMLISVTIDFEKEKIIPLDSISVPKRYAPRYGVFHQHLPIFYADMEGSASIYAFSYDELGTLQIVQTLVLPADCDQKDPMPSDIILNAAGDCLYVGIRGSNSIAVIALDPDGTMKFRKLCSNKDGAPNALRLSPDGRFLFVTNIFEKVITRFSVLENGMLEYQGVAAKDQCPASMLFLP